MWNGVPWMWQPSVLTNSQQLWLPAEDLHEIKPTAFLAWRGVELTCPTFNWGAVNSWWLQEEGELFSLRMWFLKVLCLYSFLHPITENQFNFHCAYECNTLCQGLFLASTCVCPSLLTFLCPRWYLGWIGCSPLLQIHILCLPPESLPLKASSINLPSAYLVHRALSPH